MDIDTYQRFLTTKTASSDYWKIRNQLNDDRIKTGALYVYTMEVSSNKDVKILIDGQSEGSKVASPIGESTGSSTYSQILPALIGKSASTNYA